MSEHGRAAVFLDRDGVIVVPEFRDGRSYAPTTFEAFEIYPGARESLEALRDAGFALVVVTNQPDVGAGKVSEAVLDQMHEKLLAELPIDRIEVCKHTRDEVCSCRKPKPGMLVTAASAMGIRLDLSYMIGDRESDILAGAAVGCRTIFIDLGYTSEPRPQSADWTVGSIVDAAACVIAATGTGSTNVTAR